MIEGGKNREGKRHAGFTRRMNNENDRWGRLILISLGNRRDGKGVGL